MFGIQTMTYSKLCSLKAVSVPVLRHCRYMSSRARSVLVSKSTNIYENLALETWLFENADLEKQSMLLMWRNSAAIVCGRHQNPWLECNVPMALKMGVDIARRNSGGGTVFHDEGNLNCSFLMHSSLYNRKRNLELAVDAIKARWPNTQLEINRREDIILGGHYKISGTASKLSSKRTYHHFTLLFDVDRQRLQSLLDTNVSGAASKATESLKAQVCNLNDHLLNADFDTLVRVLWERFLANEQDKSVQYIDPMDGSLFPGVEDICNELKSWDWVYGRTPEFSVNREFHRAIGNADNNIEIDLVIKKGAIHNMEVSLLQPLGTSPEALIALRLGLEGTRLEHRAVAQTLSAIKMDWIYQRYYKVETREVLDWLLLCVLETLLQFTGRGEFDNSAAAQANRL